MKDRIFKRALKFVQKMHKGQFSSIWRTEQQRRLPARQTNANNDGKLYTLVLQFFF